MLKNRKNIYLQAAMDFSEYIPHSHIHNTSKHIAYGLCDYFEHFHNIDIVSDKTSLPELDLFMEHKSEYDSHIAPCNIDGAELRVLILLFCSEICKLKNARH